MHKTINTRNFAPLLIVTLFSVAINAQNFAIFTPAPTPRSVDTFPTFEFKGCFYGEWSAWSGRCATCFYSSSNNYGSRTRSREYTSGLGRCLNVIEETVPCPKPRTECITDCFYSVWSDWTPCRELCTDTQQTRRTRIIKRAAYGGGKACDKNTLIEVDFCKPSCNSCSEEFCDYECGKSCVKAGVCNLETHTSTPATDFNNSTCCVTCVENGCDKSLCDKAKLFHETQFSKECDAKTYNFKRSEKAGLSCCGACEPKPCSQELCDSLSMDHISTCTTDEKFESRLKVGDAECCGECQLSLPCGATLCAKKFPDMTNASFVAKTECDEQFTPLFPDESCCGFCEKECRYDDWKVLNDCPDMLCANSIYNRTEVSVADGSDECPDRLQVQVCDIPGCKEEETSVLNPVCAQLGIPSTFCNQVVDCDLSKCCGGGDDEENDECASCRCEEDTPYTCVTFAKYKKGDQCELITRCSDASGTELEERMKSRGGIRCVLFDVTFSSDSVDGWAVARELDDVATFQSTPGGAQGRIIVPLRISDTPESVQQKIVDLSAIEDVALAQSSANPTMLLNIALAFLVTIVQL